MLVDISATMGLAGMLICLEGLTTLWNKGCCNVQNPFRGTWVVGTPGSGKSFLVTFLRIWISILSTSLMWSAPTERTLFRRSIVKIILKWQSGVLYRIS